MGYLRIFRNCSQCQKSNVYQVVKVGIKDQLQECYIILKFRYKGFRNINKDAQTCRLYTTLGVFQGK